MEEGSSIEKSGNSLSHARGNRNGKVKFLLQNIEVQFFIKTTGRKCLEFTCFSVPIPPATRKSSCDRSRFKKPPP